MPNERTGGESEIVPVDRIVGAILCLRGVRKLEVPIWYLKIYCYQKGTYSEHLKRRVEERCRMMQVLLGAGEWLAKEQEVQELEPFVGIGPRRYLDLFSLKLGRGSPLERKSGRMAAAWSREAARPRVPLQPMSYIDREKTAAKHVEEFLRTRSQQGGKPQ